MAGYSEDKRQLLKQFSQNLKIISVLYPDRSYSISQLANLTEWDQGTLSKAVNSMIESDLIIVKEEKQGRGKPQKIIKLSDVSFRLYSIVDGYLGKRLAENEYSDDRVLKEYFNMLDSSNEQMIEMAISSLSVESTKRNYSTDEYLVKIKEKIFDKTKSNHKNELIQIVLNLSRISDEAKLRTLDEIFRKDLLKLFYAEVQKTDKTEAIRMDALMVLAEIVAPSEKYSTLKDAYLQLIREGSAFRGSARTLLQSKYPEKVPDIKLELIRVAKESDSDLISLISDELRNLS